MRYHILFLTLTIAMPHMAYAENEYYTQQYQGYGAVPSGVTYEAVDAQLLQQISEALPERSNVNAAFLDSSYDPNISLSEDAEVFLHFIDEGAGYRNSLGYVSYADGVFDGLTKGDIDINNNNIISPYELNQVSGLTFGSIFPNASKLNGGGELLAGHTVQIGGNEHIFDAGDNVSFFVGANAWTGSGISGYDAPGDDIFSDGNSRNFFYSLDFLNPEASNTASFGYDGTADYSRHVAMLYPSYTNQSSIVMGFEDLVRPYGDNDFNDLVFTISATPTNALTGQEIYTAPSPSIGGSVAILGVAVWYARFRRRSAICRFAI